MVLKRIVVVGASLAALSAIETLRESGFDGGLTLINGEPHLPYDRPPLSKQILAGTWPAERALLRDEKHFADLGVDLRSSTRAESLDVGSRTVALDTGEHLGFDGLVIATGARPRLLPKMPDLEQVRVLRTLDDSLALRAAFDVRPRLLIVGFGFIGAEVASAARARGIPVTIIDRQPFPLSRIIGPKAGLRCAKLHRDNGVEFHFNVGIDAFLGERQIEAVRLTDGTLVQADLVIIGIGAEPCTDWLASSQLKVADGVVCDRFCAAAPGVYAAGDVARWQHVGFKESIRIEQWANAREQGQAAARNLLRGPASSEAFTPLPYVWSDQYGKTFQFVGHTLGFDDESLIDGGNQDRFAALYGKGDRVCAALVFNWPRMFAACRQSVGRSVPWSEAVAAANDCVRQE